jgi:hypothetical protein
LLACQLVDYLPVGETRARMRTAIAAALPWVNKQTVSVGRDGAADARRLPETVTPLPFERPAPGDAAPSIPAPSSLPATPHGSGRSMPGAAPACRCGHDAWDHTWRCTAQLAPDEWCDCIEWREA